MREAACCKYIGEWKQLYELNKLGIYTTTQIEQNAHFYFVKYNPSEHNNYVNKA